MNPLVILGEQAFRLYPGCQVPVLQVAYYAARRGGSDAVVVTPVWKDVAPFDYDEACYCALAALCAMRALVEASKAQDEANASARERQMA